MNPETVDSTSDNRIVNNTMRHQYKVLSDEEKAQMLKIKDLGLEFITYLNSFGSKREFSVAITHMETAVMWGVKGITG